MALVLVGTPTWGQPPTAVFPQETGGVPRQLTLEAAETLLLQQNLAIIAARYGVDLARAQRLTASVRSNPTLTLGGEQFNLNHSGQDLTTTSPTASQRTYTFRIDQLFERGRKRQMRTEAADFQLQAAEAQVLDTIRTQRLQLRQAFYTAVLARENIRVAVENLDLTTATERLIQVRVKAGDGPACELIKFQANKVAFQQDLVKAQLADQQAASDLRTLLSGSAGGLVRPLPAGGPPSLPLFVFNTFQGLIDQGLAAPQQATTALEQTRLGALTDVDKAYEAYQTSQALLQVYTTETLAKAQESFQIATTTYRRGATSLLEVQEAQRTLNQTQVVPNQAHFDYRLSLAHLAQALGAPWRRPRQVRRASPLDAHGSARPPWPGREVWR